MLKTRPGWLIDRAQLDYPTALARQHRLVDMRHQGSLNRDLLIVLEHPAVFTLGRRGGLENLTVPREALERKGISVVPAERGGNITYHGPGQIVAYPIVHLPSAGWKVVTFVGALEEIMIRTALDFAVNAARDPRNRGVWVADRKLGSLGIAVRRGVSFHGLALNVNTDLIPFCWVHPCGLSGIEMTSLAVETGHPLPMARVRKVLIKHAADILGMSLERTDFQAILGPPGNP